MNQRSLSGQKPLSPLMPPTRGVLQRACACGQHTSGGGECEECRKKREGALQRAATDSTAVSEVPPIVHEVLNSPGQPLDEGTRAFMEPRFGRDFSRVRTRTPAVMRSGLALGAPGDVYEAEAERVASAVTAIAGAQTDSEARSPLNTSSGSDFSRVRVHTGARAAESARAVNALAYTVGNDIVFGEGQFSSGTAGGRQLLAHELAHVVQQGGGESSSGGLRMQRACAPASCPAQAEEIPAMPPIPFQAEKCLQNLYAETHPAKPGISLGFNLGWLTLTGKDANERAALGCLRGASKTRKGVNFTAKSALWAAEPDIWDFSSRTMYEITTKSQLGYKAGDTGKLAAQIELANELTSSMDCGGLVFSPGDWAPPSPCYLLDSGIYISVVNVGGVLIYLPLKEGEKDLDWSKVFSFLTAAAAAAAMAAALKAAGRAGAKAGARGAAGPVGTAYTIVSLAAAATLIGCGKGQLKVGDGEEPIQALYKAMAAKGTPVPPELQKMIDDDPALKAKIENALKPGGDPTAAQKELNEQILKLVNENKDSLSKEELEAILTATAVSGSSLPQGQSTSQVVRQMLQQQGAGRSAAGPNSGQGNVWERAKDAEKAGPGGSGGAGGANKSNVWDKARETGGAAQEIERKYPGLNQESRNKLAGASAPVRKLFEAFTSGKNGPRVTDDVVTRFLSAVPADLTDEQANAIAARLGGSTVQSIDEIFAELKKAVDQARTPEKAAEQPSGDAGVAEKKQDAAEAPAPSGSDTTGEAQKTPGNSIFSSKIFEGLQRGSTVMTPTPTDKTKPTDVIMVGITTQGVGYAGAAQVQLVRTSADGKTLRIKILRSNAMVDAKGNVVFAASVLTGNEGDWSLN